MHVRPRSRSRWLQIGILLLAGVVPAASALAEPDSAWPEFRGWHRSGTSRDARFPDRFGPGTNELWNVPVPGGHSSPVVSGTVVAITGFESNRLVTLALHRDSGRMLWRAEVSPGKIESGSRLSHPATATMTTDGTRWISSFAPFGLVAYDGAGRELWQLPLPTPVTQHGASSSPVLASGLVIQVCDQDVGSYLIAVDARSGAVRWRTERSGVRRGFSTPIPWPAHHPEVIVVAGTLGLVAYDLSDGRERWRARGLPNEMVSSPVADARTIYAAGWTPGAGVHAMPPWESLCTEGDRDGDGRLTRDEAPAGPAKQHFVYIDADKDGMLTEDEYTSISRIFLESRNTAIAVRPNGEGDVTDSHVNWRASRGLPYVPTPLAHDGLLYLVRNGGLVSCLDVRTGEYAYQEERLGALGDYYSSPIVAGDRILVIAQPGTAVVYRTGRTLDVLARIPLGEPVLATPALVGGTLYVRTQSRLIAFRDPAP